MAHMADNEGGCDFVFYSSTGRMCEDVDFGNYIIEEPRRSSFVLVVLLNLLVS